ncbi:hypothetical protein CDV31_008231 [Fusarium ambrosium]|uniref:Uncharacterized protein n=1 Tax=Fusarium ambrosium TaxID=131363 RepID=A0A428U1Q3_9HYPO|nr:hypothetical protein CDV31_008231 [Fusarium ambrosium]
MRYHWKYFEDLGITKDIGLVTPARVNLSTGSALRSNDPGHSDIRSAHRYGIQTTRLQEVSHGLFEIVTNALRAVRASVMMCRAASTDPIDTPQKSHCPRRRRPVVPTPLSPFGPPTVPTLVFAEGYAS